MNFKKKLLLVAILVALGGLAFTGTLAEEVVPYANPVFNSTGISLSTSLKATFNAVTSRSVSISVKSVYLEYIDADGETHKISVDSPGVTRTGNIYSVTKDYHEDAGQSGRYRVCARFWGDNEYIDAQSNWVNY